jgi:hypothetical protein
MADLSDAAKAAMRYYPEIQGSVSSNASTADVWAAIRDRAGELGLGTPGVTIQGVNELRSYAAQIRNASQRLNKAPDNYALEANMIAQAPWSRSITDQEAEPMWQVRFQHTTLHDGVETTEWRTSVFRNALPPTVGALARDVESDAYEMAADYGFEHTGIDNIAVLAI